MECASSTCREANMIKIEKLNVVYKNGLSRIEAIKNFTISIEVEFLSIVGPSGCGKSTLLRVLSGLINPTDGKIKFLDSDSKSHAIVFQDYSLLPWLTVRKNIELGLIINGVNPANRLSTSEKLLEQLNLKEAANYLPHQLSGGMQQRVAVGRAFAQSPSLLLMDEPFGALDAITREELQQVLTNLYEGDPHTIIFVTHDVEEAIYLSDRVCILSNRPGTVREIIKIPFARPRKPEIKRSTEFINLKYELEDFLRK